VVETIAFANWKGGVGKTTSAANVGAALAERGRRVVLVDLDPQANLTESFGLLEEPAIAVGELLGRDGAARAGEALVSVGANLDLLPSSSELGDLAWTLVGDADYRDRLPELLRSLEGEYAFALLDTPPGVGLWPGLALLASDAVVVPTRPHDSDVMATGKLYDYIEAEIRPRNPGLRVLGALVTQGGSRWRLLRDTRRRFEFDRIATLTTEIPASVRVAAAPRAGRPSVWLEPDGNVACAYRRVADELLAALVPA